MQKLRKRLGLKLTDVIEIYYEAAAQDEKGGSVIQEVREWGEGVWRG